LIRIAHLSDLHFAKPTFRLSQFFSKRWIGNFHCILRRRKEFSSKLLDQLCETLRANEITHAILSGDFTTTSLKSEFALARSFVDKLERQGITCYTLPGNHDKYTKRSQKKRLYYKFFPNSDLMGKGLSIHHLDDKLWLILLDTAFATSWIHATGLFSEYLEDELEKTLLSIPKSDKIIIANHFPFFQNDNPLHTLRRGEALQAVLERHPHVQIYLHGHTHRHTLCDLRKTGLPIVLDSGSAAYKKRASFNCIDIASDACEIRVFRHGNHWQEKQRVSYTWPCELSKQ